MITVPSRASRSRVRPFPLLLVAVGAQLNRTHTTGFLLTALSSNHFIIREHFVFVSLLRLAGGLRSTSVAVAGNKLA